MSQEVLIRERKKKRTKYPLLEPKTEESEEQYSTQDENPQTRIRARDFRLEMRDVIHEENEKARLQKELIEMQKRKMEEENYNIRRGLNDLTKSELGNVSKVVLSDRTITLGKGRQHQRRHRKILGGLYHSDQEESVEVEFRRAGAEEQ